MVVADMPFSYQINLEEAFRNAGRFIQEAGADAVKSRAARSAPSWCDAHGKRYTGSGPHRPYTSVHQCAGGYKVQGKTHEARDRLIEDAQALAEAGAFAIVLECTPSDIVPLSPQQFRCRSSV